MVSIERTRVGHRGRAAIVTVVIFTALTLAGSVPPTAAAQPTPSPGETCTPGRIVDFCRDLRGESQGYLLDKGVFTTVDAPGVAVTIPFDINNRGQIVGGYIDAGGTEHGFLLDKGTFTTIDVPDALMTQVLGINNRAQIVGTYLDAGGTQHGVLVDKGTFTTIDVPGFPATTALDINDRGQIVGASFRPSGDVQ